LKFLYKEFGYSIRMPAALMTLFHLSTFAV
jgi:hypothetical protein